MRLETERLALRDWEETDVEDLVEGLNDLEVSKWLVFVPHPYTAEDACEWITCCISNSRSESERDSYEFAIALKSENKVIGGIGLANMNRSQGTAGGGMWLSAGYHGHGYGSEAWREYARFAFEDLGLRRLENGFFEGNDASRGVQEKLGYRIEGLRREAFVCMADGKIKNEHLTGLLKRDWEKFK